MSVLIAWLLILRWQNPEVIEHIGAKRQSSVLTAGHYLHVFQLISQS